MPQASIIHSFIDKLPPADKTTWFRDTALAGSVLSVGLSPKIFHAAVEFNHSFRRMKIGRDDAVQANVARRIARDEMDLSRFDAAPLIAFTATKETDYGTWKNGRIP